MKYVNCTADKFLQKIYKKSVIYVGASSMTDSYIDANYVWFEKIIKQIKFVADNDVNKHGKCLIMAGYKKNILPFKAIEKEKMPIILIAAGYKYVEEIIGQLESMQLHSTTECYCLRLLLENGVNLDSLMGVNLDSILQSKYNNEKIIHCCWFSGDKKPKKYQDCIDSWKKYCPDYRIIEWNADNYDFGKNNYLREAFESKSWAFASDYVRLDVIYQYGGIYMDMDVELLRCIDELLNLRAFFCFDWLGYIDLGSGFGAIKNDQLVKKLLQVYSDIHFVNRDGICDKTPQPTRLMSYFEQAGLIANGVTQVIEDRVFLSGQYFSVVGGGKKEDFAWKGKEYALHWHNAGWFDDNKSELRQRNYFYRDKVKRIFKDN